MKSQDTHPFKCSPLVWLGKPCYSAENTTGLRINAEYNCWTVVDPRDVDFRPRRHYVGMRGRAMAFFDAARLAVTGKDKAG